MRQNEAAAQDYERAIELLGARTPASAHNDLGVAWTHLGRPDRAIECLTAALEVDPDLPLALVNRGALLEKQGQHELAMMDFERVIRSQTAVLTISPDDGDALCMRGAAANRANRLQDALIDLTRALELLPPGPKKLGKALRHRGEVLLKLKRFDQAAADLNACLGSDPHNPVVLALRKRTLQAALTASSAAGDTVSNPAQSTARGTVPTINISALFTKPVPPPPSPPEEEEKQAQRSPTPDISAIDEALAAALRTYGTCNVIGLPASVQLDAATAAPLLRFFELPEATKRLQQVCNGAD